MKHNNSQHINTNQCSGYSEIILIYIYQFKSKFDTNLEKINSIEDNMIEENSKNIDKQKKDYKAQVIDQQPQTFFSMHRYFRQCLFYINAERTLFDAQFYLIEKDSNPKQKEKRYACSLCEKTFAKSCALGGHMARMHRKTEKKMKLSQNLQQDDNNCQASPKIIKSANKSKKIIEISSS